MYGLSDDGIYFEGEFETRDEANERGRELAGDQTFYSAFFSESSADELVDTLQYGELLANYIRQYTEDDHHNNEGWPYDKMNGTQLAELSDAVGATLKQFFAHHEDLAPKQIGAWILIEMHEAPVNGV